MPPIFNFGTEEQKQRWLVPGIAGEKIGALGITEPGAGSDVAGITTSAERVDGGYVVNGAKTFITNGVRADFLVCACKTTEEGGHGGISFLVLEREMPGYEVAQKLEKMGWHSSDTGELSFTDVEVPAENLLGEENERLQTDHGQLRLGAAADGDRRRRRDAAPDRDHRRLRPRARSLRPPDRQVPGDPPPRRRDGDQGRGLPRPHLQRPAPLPRRARTASSEVTMAKLVTQRAVLEIADQSLQIHGGYGYMREYGIERAVRDARLGPIGGGTDEVMKGTLIGGARSRIDPPPLPETRPFVFSQKSKTVPMLARRRGDGDDEGARRPQPQAEASADRAAERG